MKKLVCFLFVLMTSSIYSEPRVSIITSLYKGDEFIEFFMSEIVKQTIFDQCELIIINANSPGNESAAIEPYLRNYSNIYYLTLNYDPGIYGVWNMAIEMAQGEYITNANVDDGLAYDCYEKFVQIFDNNRDIDVVYANYYMVQEPNQTFQQARKNGQLSNMPECTTATLKSCSSPNNHPMWRKSLHKKYGYFDESYRSAGDYEMWIRLAANNVKFKKIEEPLGIYYLNPHGMSTSKDSPSSKETAQIVKKYSYLWR